MLRSPGEETSLAAPPKKAARIIEALVDELESRSMAPTPTSPSPTHPSRSENDVRRLIKRARRAITAPSSGTGDALSDVEEEREGTGAESQDANPVVHSPPATGGSMPVLPDSWHGPATERLPTNGQRQGRR